MDGFPQFKNLVEMTMARAASHGENELTTFLSDTGSLEGTLTFAGLDRAARNIAAHLTEEGLARKNLMLLYTPGLDYIKAFFGCLYAGSVPVPAYPPMGARDIDRLKRIVVDCDAAAILSSSTLRPMINAWISNPSNGLNISCVPTDLSAAVEAPGFASADVASDSLAFLQYTSGSTGHPKGVMVSHRNLLENFRQIVWTFSQGSNDFDAISKGYKTVIWLPPFHDMGLIGGVLTPVYAGAQVTLMSPLTFLKNPFLWLKAISDAGAMVSGGPNFSYQYCVSKITDEQVAQLDLSSWGVAFNGAEPIQVDALHSFAKKFAAAGFDARAFLPCYGLAEATLFVAGSPAFRGALVRDASLVHLVGGEFVPLESGASSEVSPLVSSGVVATGADVRIVDSNTHVECVDGKVGEIWVNSPSVAQGYWNKPSFSDSVFRAHIQGQEDKAWMRTGDLGFLWEGELFVTGRLKEMIIVAGRNHYPQDIEQTLQACNSAFRRGCGAAFAVSDHGKEALVVMQELSSTQFQPAEYQQLALQAAKAIAFRHGISPKALVFIVKGSLAKTSSGKIQRTAAKKVYESGNLTSLYYWENAPQNIAKGNENTAPSRLRQFTDWQSELYLQMQTWVSNKLNIETHHVDLNVTFSELGVDSIEAIELVDSLQNAVQRTIPAIELLRYPTVKALIEHFAKELSERDANRNDGYGTENVSDVDGEGVLNKSIA
ncbi:probable AMP-dependent synthetase and ligase [gamma proteobacterium HdN1]|nr:probable AMP-dependent synthetase and ligase [gamma proteobacterium HdN1]